MSRKQPSLQFRLFPWSQLVRLFTNTSESVLSRVDCTIRVRRLFGNASSVDLFLRKWIKRYIHPVISITLTRLPLNILSWSAHLQTWLPTRLIARKDRR